MAGDISPPEPFSNVNFIGYLKTIYIETFKFKVDRIPKFFFAGFDTWVIVKVLNFFGTI